MNFRRVFFIAFVILVANVPCNTLAATSTMEQRNFIEKQGTCSKKVKQQRYTQTKKDCLKISSDGRIIKIEGYVAQGDAMRIKKALSKLKGSVEIRLNSGGGNSAEGMKIGLVFRKSNLLIRVANGSSCASACTVAFMGGKFRTIDSKAKFQVHIYSSYMNGFDRLNGFDFNLNKSPGFVWKNELLKNPREFLLAIAKDQHGLHYRSSYPNSIVFKENVYSNVTSIKVARRFSYLRNMIQSVKKIHNNTNMEHEANKLSVRLQIKRTQSFNNYVENHLDNDIQNIIEGGGRSAAHQIAMRIERETAFNMIAGLCEINERQSQFKFISSDHKPWEVADKLFSLCKTSRFDNLISSKNNLGNRSSSALRMIITMFESRIQGVSVLSPATLFNYGFTNVEE